MMSSGEVWFPRQRPEDPWLLKGLRRECCPRSEPPQLRGQVDSSHVISSHYEMKPISKCSEGREGAGRKLMDVEAAIEQLRRDPSAQELINWLLSLGVVHQRYLFD